MFLKQLVLKGFKSFAVRSALSFEPGLSVVVGPNGSGKSNISDAVLWVLGEQSPKHLRGQAMEDVIFSGSSARKAVSVAEVELVLDNSDHALPIEYEEVSIIRRIYRSGDSEYLINGAPCRLMDIREVLHDTGLGRDAHTIISQGSLDAVIKAKPEDRRMLIEEAAGILKHRERKERSARKMKAMGAHLERVRDIQREVRRQLKPLERQAQRARQHDEIAGKLKELELGLAVDDLKSLQAQWDGVIARESEASAAAEICEIALKEREAELLKYQKTLEEHGLYLGDVADARRRWQSAADRLASCARVLGEREANLALRATEAAGQVSANRELATRASAQATQIAAQADEGKARLAALEASLGELEAKMASLKAARREASSDYERLSKEQRQRQDELRDVRAKLSKANESLASYAFQDEALQKRIAELDALLASDEAAMQKAVAEADAKDAELAAANDAAKAADDAAARASEILAKEDSAYAKATEALNALLSEILALEKVEKAFDDANPALARALDDPAIGKGAISRISKAFAGVGEYEELVEALLGPDALGIIAKDAEASEEIACAIEGFAADGIAGRVSIMPAEPQGSAEGQVSRPKEIGGAVRLMSLIEPAPGLEGIADALLGDVYVADDIAGAHRAASALPKGTVARFATRGGAVVWPTGKIEAGKSASDADGILARQERLAQLRAGEAPARDASAAAAARRDEAAKALTAARASAAKATQDAARLRGEATSAKREVERLSASKAARAKERERTCEQRAQMQAGAQKAQPLKEEYELRIASIEKEMAVLEGQMAQSAATRRERIAEEGKIESQATTLKVDLATLSERQKSLSSQAASLQAQSERALSAIDAAKASRRLARIAMLRLKPLKEALSSLTEGANERAQELRDRQMVRQVDSESLSGAIAKARREAEAAKEQASKAAQELADVNVEKARIETKVEAAMQHIVRDLKVDVETALEATLPEDRAACEDQVHRLSHRLERLGAVNPDAKQEYEEVKARDDYITAQVEDLEGASRALARIVAAIDRKMRESFLATFDVVNDNFKQIFGRFFPGGKATLILTDPDNPDLTGVELDVQPKGKQIRRTQLMSGGEQALVSIALLFAVYRTRSVPFYILDEVEPALDDTNLSRLTQFLDEMRHETQLIMITHQRRTMELADVLYGVSMQADGVSKLVSQRLDKSGKWVEDKTGAKVTS